MRFNLIFLAFSASLALPAAAQDDPTCWAPPPQSLKKDALAKLSEAMNEAARAARPAHAKRDVLELPSASSAKTAALECTAVVSTDLAIEKGRWSLTLRMKDGEARELASSVVTVDPKTFAPSDLSAIWTTFWKHTDPAPPAPAASQAAAPEPIVDADLAVERAREAPRPVAPDPPRVRLLLASGINLRSLSSAPGTPLDDGAVLSFGGEATLRIGSWIGAPHALDITAGYNRRLARVVVGRRKISVDADRAHAEAAYRVDLFGGLAGGLLLGWEMLRFEVDPQADVLSVRYGVMRVGLGVRQSLVEGAVAVDLTGWGALRLTPGGDANTGFDLGVGPEITIDQRFALRLLARWASHTGDLGGGFEDDQFDFELGVGVLL